MTDNSYTVLIMAGGTGGHVFPGIAIADELKKHNVVVHWLGTEGGMEEAWVEKAQIPFSKISIKGLRGNGLAGWLKAPVNVSRAWSQARKVMQLTKPDLVLGMGGFVCGPGGLAAKSLGIPLVLHEQNSIPGLTNKILAPFAKKVITAFPQKKIQGKQVVQIGNPVRAGLESVTTVQAKKSCHLLVLGGSRGALALNETLPKAVALLPENQRPTITHQTGQASLAQAQQAYLESGVTADVVPFIDDMLNAYENADMVLSRSGALTVSELMATARPAIMVPYPHAVDDHQTDNAQALVELQGGEIIQQTDLTAERLSEALRAWCLDSSKRVAASESIREQAKTQATEKIVNILLELIQVKDKS